MLEVINLLQTTYLDPGIVSAESSLCATIHWGYTCVFWFVRMPPHPLCNNFNWKVVAHICLQTLSAKVCEMFVFEIRIKKNKKLWPRHVHFKATTRGTLRSDTWYMQLAEKLIARSYHLLDDDWTPLSRNPCWLSRDVHHRRRYKTSIRSWPFRMWTRWAFKCAWWMSISCAARYKCL